MITDAVSPLRVGIVGTGYAAKKRAEALKSDSRAELLVVSGQNPQRLAEFCSAFEVKAVNSWHELVQLSQLDLVFICTINQGCGAIAKAAILAGKHVVVEYPLDLAATVAEEVIELAAVKQKLLHVEHMEIIGGLHQSLKRCLPQIGKVFHASYKTIAPQHPVEQNWKYHRQQFGFPLAAGLSRIHRLTDLFGKVTRVDCRDRYWGMSNSDYFNACFCQAQLNFHHGITADLIYGKGDVFWQSDRTLEIYGEKGKIIFVGEKGTLFLGEHPQEIPVIPRRGLFAQDTTMVLDYLWSQQALYIHPQASLYALRVANAAQKSAQTEQAIDLD
jgi:biliverdin reductase